jgi:hypothetical protein
LRRGCPAVKGKDQQYKRLKTHKGHPQLITFNEDAIRQSGFPFGIRDFLSLPSDRVSFLWLFLVWSLSFYTFLSLIRPNNYSFLALSGV